MVYFIADIKNNLCKIGYSERPNRRMATLQTGYPFELTLIKSIEGTFDDEKLLHYKYSAYKLKGEWFYMDKIDEIKNEVVESFYDIELVCGVEVKIDKKSGMYNLSDFINKINSQNVLNNRSLFNLSTWINSEDTKILKKDVDHLLSINSIIRKSNTWAHFIIFHDLTLALGSHFKVAAHSYMASKYKSIK